MKILQLGKYYPPDCGGIETVMFDITEGLNERGIKCDVLCSNSKNEYKEESRNGYKIYRVKSYGKIASTSIAPQMIFKLRKIIGDYDVIHIHFPDPMANIALMLSNHKNKKIVLHWHSDIVKQKNLLKLYLPFQNWLLKRADKIIATTPKYIEESPFLSKYKEKCVSIPIGINEKRLKIKEELIEKIRNDFKNKRIIFSLGRLTYYKGFKYLIESAEYLSEDFVILIGGTGELKEELKELIKKKNLQTKIFLLGKVKDEDLGSYYKACDLFVLPSIEKSEAFGVVQIEAMSFAKPVVATKIKGSGVDWVNEDGISGINVEPKNPKILADAIKKIINDRDLYIKFSKNARKRFERFFMREKMVKSIINIYKETLK
jgi:rhamnosyl/mannosyltransferase